MILLLGGIKGGSGKTTIATNFAVMLSLSGKDVLLVDSDEQETASDFTILRNDQLGDAGYTCIKLTGAAVRSEVTRLAPKYDHIIIDTGGRDTTSQRAGMVVCDMMLIPFVPRSFDIWTLEQVGGLVEEMRPANVDIEACTFINRADPRGVDNAEAAEILKEFQGLIYIDAPIVTRKAFGNAAAGGLAVTEQKPRDLKAIQEIETLFQRVYDVSMKLK